MNDILENTQSNWGYLCQFFPADWSSKMKELGMLKYGRKFGGDDGESKLLRTLLIHLSGNISLRSTSAVVRKAKIVDVSDVAILKRLKKSSAWFTWCTNELLHRQNILRPQSCEMGEYNLRFVDATIVDEPGATGSRWRLHYSLNCETFAPDEIISGGQKRGEGLHNFEIQANDLMIGDRAYGTRRGIKHVSESGGFVLTRFSPHNLPLVTEQGNPLQLRQKLRRLGVGEIGEIEAFVNVEKSRIRGRVCVLRKTEGQARKAEKSVRRKAAKGGNKITDATIEYASYIMIFTTLPGDVSAKAILDTYRYRWQIELVFKRMKSLLRLAPLYRKSEEGMMGWLSGKLFIATLAEYMLACADSFFPWGYPIER